ncbi:MAG: type II secretion system protein [Bacillati bacterium ANGP1]|uniref:Type II secretion system protein n=1 Tax=Candidatus Segetimicrobium genomatis TaxID=2569760 RepID=A0A537KDC2_9BACT|nr:MAG: type II secretion system protein [Terrabacteria group bacterium ANGP1]
MKGRMSGFAMMKRARAQDGFSLIELAVALALAGIIITGAMFNVRGAMNREALDGWVRSTTLDIAWAQQSAVTQRAPVNVTLTSTTYTLAACPSACNTFKVGRLPADITITTTCASNVCTFDKRGVPAVAGTITLTSASTGASNVITIQSNTGSVTYQ